MSFPLPRIRTETPLALKRRARRMARVLRAEYPDAHCELDHDDAFQLLVATVLSAQTTDVRVNSVTPALFARCPTPAAMASAPLVEIEELIRPTGFFRAKAQNIQALAARLCEHYHGEVPGRLTDLVTLPGVGRKTANVVLGNAFGVPGLTVDTHFGRLVRRFGWTAETDPVKVEQVVGDLIPRAEWTILSHVLIFHGRRVCHSRTPACGACVVASSCPSFGIGVTEQAAAQALVRPSSGPHRSLHDADRAGS